MYRKYRFNLLVAVTLLVLAVLIVRQGMETARIASASASSVVEVSNQAEEDQCPYTLEERQSIRSVYIKEIGLWLPRSDKGMNSVDGGVIALLDCK